MRKYQVVYLDSVYLDLVEIREYLDEHSVSAWAKLISKLEKQTKNL